MAYWEERLTSEEYKEVEKVFRRRRRGKKSASDYDDLTNAGLTPEEASEMLDLDLG